MVKAIYFKNNKISVGDTSLNSKNTWFLEAFYRILTRTYNRGSVVLHRTRGRFSSEWKLVDASSANQPVLMADISERFTYVKRTIRKGRANDFKAYIPRTLTRYAISGRSISSKSRHYRSVQRDYMSISE
jgi:hypothetical protein